MLCVWCLSRELSRHILFSASSVWSVPPSCKEKRNCHQGYVMKYLCLDRFPLEIVFVDYFLLLIFNEKKRSSYSGSSAWKNIKLFPAKNIYQGGIKRIICTEPVSLVRLIQVSQYRHLYWTQCFQNGMKSVKNCDLLRAFKCNFM